MNDLISVVVPVYRVEKYLNRCIKSILKQTYSNLEIILVDDGSDDKCPQMCDSYTKFDDRIKVIHQENKGLSDARNSGIEIAKGKYIAFVDSDDCVSEHYIEYLHRALLETGADISQCGYTIFQDENIPEFMEYYTVPIVWNKIQALRSQMTFGTNIVSTVSWNKLYDMSLFKSIRYTPGKLHEDEFTTYRVFDQASSIAYINISLYGYFQNECGIMHSPIRSAHIDALEAKLNRYFYYKDKGYQELLLLAATECFDSLLVLAKKMDKAMNKKTYVERLQLYLNQIKTINKSDLNQQYKIILRLSNSPKQLMNCYNIFMFCGKISRILKLSRIKKLVLKKRTIKKYSNELKNIFKDYRPSKTVFILGAVEYENLGDQAIVVAQKKFIHFCLTDYDIIEIGENLYRYTREELKNIIKPESLLTIPGGGNMGDVWFDDEERRRDIIKDYPNNRIIVFPQTIDYSDTEKGNCCLKESIEIYNNHRNLILCAREQISFDKMKKFYPNCKIILAPDIVLSLKPKLHIKREKVLICLRNDKEKIISHLFLDEIKNASFIAGFQYKYTDTIASSYIFCKDRMQMVMSKLTEFASSKLVITDRLHGMIFAAITCTPCIALPNGNHKIKGVFDLWLSNSLFIQYIEQPKAEDIVKMYFSANQLIKNNFEFNIEKFNQIKEVLTDGKNETPN